MSYQDVPVEAVSTEAGSLEPARPRQDTVELNPRLATAHGKYLGNKYFSSLDGLRCLAITSVMSLHSFWDFMGVQRWGDQGVSLFFVISGFLITTLLLRERSRDGTISLKSFYIRRTLRIFPLYYAVLALYVPVVYLYDIRLHGNDPTLAAEGRMFFHNLPYFLTYTGNLFMDKSLAHTHFLHSWSLATEEQFYLIWPAVILLSGRKTLAPVFFMLAVILAETILWYMTVHNTVDLGYFGIAIVSNVQPSICMGALLAYALHFPRSFRWAEPVLGRKWSGTVFFVAAAVILWLGNVPNFFLYLAMVGMVGSVCIREHHPLRWLLSNRAVVYIGTISYGMYMLNQLCRNAVTMRLHVYNQFLYFLVTAGLTVLLATLSYFFFEQQFLRIKDRFRRVEAKPDYVVPTVPA